MMRVNAVDRARLKRVSKPMAATSVARTTVMPEGSRWTCYGARWMRPVILVVDDDAEVLDVIAEMLGRLGYDARLAGTATDAYASAQAERPSAILLDINLPDASGTQTLDRLRLLCPDVPVIMVTANADESLARETLTRGAFDYVMKPFDMERLGQVLEAAVDSSPR